MKVCEISFLKNNKQRKGLVTNPLLFKEYNSRCQVDLIDMQSQPDGEYRFILNYQDHLTKFVRLVPLKHKSASDVAVPLIHIFCEIVAPTCLQSDNGG